MSSVFFVPIIRLVAGLTGAFLAAVITVVILSCGYVLLQLRDFGDTTTIVDGLLFIASTTAYASTIVAFFAITFLALPLIIIFQRLGCTSKKHYILSGMMIGLAVISAVEIWRRWQFFLPPFHMGADEYFFVVSAIAAGAMAALTYWSIALPDRTWR